MHKEIDSRNQAVIYTLNDLIKADNPVRTLDALVDEVIHRGKIDIPTGKSTLGRRAYSAVDLVKLFIYGYINGITSCRSLEHAAEINLEVHWLIKGQVPSYKTISDFRKNNSSFIRQIYNEFISLLMDSTFITNKTWVLDGNKIKASASRDMLSVRNLKKQVLALDLQIETLLDEQTDNKKSFPEEHDDDPQGGSSSGGSASGADELGQKIKSRDEMLSLIEEAVSSDKNYISPTDSDALLIRSRRGTCAGYNAQVVVDAENHMIVGLELADVAADTKSLYTVIKSTSENVNANPETVLADKGYTNYSDIQRVYEEITEGVRVQLQKTKRENSKLSFTYVKEHEHVICPQGKIMKYRGQQSHRGLTYSAFQCDECGSCPIRTQCTKSPNGRTYRLSENHEFMEMYRALMQSDAAIELTKRRKCIVEHVFGTIAHMMHYNGFKLRGKDKVMTEMHLHAIGYNFKRLFKLLSPTKLPGLSNKMRLAALMHFYFALISSLYVRVSLYIAPIRKKWGIYSRFSDKFRLHDALSLHCHC